MCENKNQSISFEIGNFYQKIFKEKNGLYLIPHYQRPYSWETKQIEDLWNDLFFAAIQNPDTPYLLGSIYFANVFRDKIEEYVHSDVIKNVEKHLDKEAQIIIDGQQRLTTMYLLLLAFGNEEINKGLFWGTTRDMPKLWLGGNDYECFKDLVTKDNLNEDIQKTKSNKRLIENYKKLKNKINACTEAEAEKILNFIKEKLQIGIITVKDDISLAMTIFVSQTDRGKRLTNLEKIKGLLIFYVQKDSVGKPLSPEINLYSYARNNPLVFIDPLGLYSTHDFLTDTATYSGVVAWGLTYSPGGQGGALVFGGIAAFAIGLDVSLYSQYKIIDTVKESLKIGTHELAGPVIDLGAETIKEQIKKPKEKIIKPYVSPQKKGSCPTHHH